MFKNISKFEKIVIVICCVALLLLTHFIINDGWLFGKQKISTEGNIGSIQVSINDVRRKSPAEFIWINPKKDDVVFKGDSIFTGANSKAKVQLSNGTIIEVQENSLVVLDIKGDDVLLDLKFGQFKGEIAAGNIQIKNKDETVKVDAQKGSVINLSKTKSGKFNLQSLVGKSSITIKDKVHNVEQNKSAEVSDQGKVEIATFEEITTSTPELNLTIYPSFKQNIDWSIPSGSINYELSYSESEGPNSKAIVKKLKKNQFLFSYEDLKPTLFWKVKAYDAKNKLVGESQKFKINSSLYPTPSLIQPLAMSRIEFKPLNYKETSTQVEFKVKSANNFQTPLNLEISKDNKFKKNVIRVALAQEIYQHNLSTGIYFVRLLEDSPIAKSNNLWSEPIQFELVADLKDGEVSAPNPTLTRYNFFPEYDQEGIVDRSKTPQISWKLSEKATSYTVELSSSRQFTNSKSFVTQSTNWNWTDFDWGKYYIRIKAQSPIGNMSEASPTIELNVLAKKPILESPPPATLFSENVEPQSLNVKWTKIPEAKKYKIEYTESNFKEAKILESRAPASTITLDKPGSYKWRVVPMDENNRPLTSYSDEGSLQFILKKPLIKPSLLSPYDNTTIYQQILSSSQLWLEWKPVDGAENYLIEVASNPDFKSANRFESKKNKFMLSNKKNGKNYWRIRAIASTFESTWSDPRLFEVKSEETLKKKKGPPKK